MRRRKNMVAFVLDSKYTSKLSTVQSIIQGHRVQLFSVMEGGKRRSSPLKVLEIFDSFLNKQTIYAVSRF